jgi:hypothetical protein
MFEGRMSKTYLRGRAKQPEQEIATAEESLKRGFDPRRTSSPPTPKENSRRNVAWKGITIRLANRLRLDGERYCARVLAATNPTKAVSLEIYESPKTSRLRVLLSHAKFRAADAPIMGNRAKGARRRRAQRFERSIRASATNVPKSFRGALRQGRRVVDESKQSGGLPDVAKALLCVNLLIDQQTQHGSDELDGMTALGLSRIVYDSRGRFGGSTPSRCDLRNDGTAGRRVNRAQAGTAVPTQPSITLTT